tara:strand:- start:7032 stop:8771 length:1740 start_codon:yes stop_codon:yes gene_type:complete
MKRLLDVESSFFNRIRICDGGSTQDILDLYKQYPNCDVFHNKWDDDMSIQHNHLLQQARIGEWIFILDDDEILSTQLRIAIEQYITELGRNYNTFRIASIQNMDGYYPKPIDYFIENAIEGKETVFTKAILFKYDGTQEYTGASHYGLKEEKRLYKDFIYEPIIHYKTYSDILWCDVYQSFINHTMQGITDTQFSHLSNALNHHNIKSIIDLKSFLEKGNIPQNVKDVIVSWRDKVLDTRGHWYYYYYYELHPEEIEDFNVGDNIPLQMYIRDVGGFNFHSVPGEWDIYPLYHLKLNPILLKMIGKDYISIYYQRFNDGGIDKIYDQKKEELIEIPEIVSPFPTGITYIEEENDNNILPVPSKNGLINDTYWNVFNRNMNSGIHHTDTHTRIGYVQHVCEWLTTNGYKDGTLLNVGVGDSAEAIEFTSYGLDVVGITNSADEVVYANERDVIAYKMDMHQLTFEDESFDYIYIHDTLEHSICPVMAFTHFRRVLKPNGLLIVHYPPFNEIMNWTHWFLVKPETMKNWFIKFGFAEMLYEDYGEENTSQYLFIEQKVDIAKDLLDKGANVIHDMLLEIKT